MHSGVDLNCSRVCAVVVILPLLLWRRGPGRGGYNSSETSLTRGSGCEECAVGRGRHPWSVVSFPSLHDSRQGPCQRPTQVAFPGNKTILRQHSVENPSVEKKHKKRHESRSPTSH